MINFSIDLKLMEYMRDCRRTAKGMNVSKPDFFATARSKFNFEHTLEYNLPAQNSQLEPNSKPPPSAYENLKNDTKVILYL